MKRRSGWLALVLPVLFALSPALAGDDLDRARTRMGSGDRAEARAILDSLLAASDSLSADTRTEAYYLRTLLEDDGSAFADRLLSLLEDVSDERKGRILLSLGKIRFSEGNLTEALNYFQEAAEAGLLEEGRLWEGLTAYALGDGPGARAALEQVRASGNRRLRQRALLIMGDTHREAKAWEEARGYYREVREEKGESTGWWSAAVFREAECLEQLGETAELIQVLQELVARAPRSYEGPMARARLAALDAPAPPVENEAVEEQPNGPASATYAVQVGAFGSEENAATLAQEVEQAGFVPVRVNRGEDNLYRVFVGRVTERIAAEALGDSLGASLGLGFSVVKEP